MKTQLPRPIALVLTGWLLTACQTSASSLPAAAVKAPDASPSPTVALIKTEPTAPSPPTLTPAVPLTAVAVAPIDTPIPTNTPTAEPPSPYKDFGSAPEIDTEIWLNSDAPLRLADLQGQVVLVDFWTYG